MSSQATSKSVRAYARGTRLVLGVQVFVAAAALAASLWLGVEIADRTRALNETAATLQTTREDARNTAEALGYLQEASRQLTADLPQYQAAAVALQSALQVLPDSAADLQRPVLKLLADTQSNLSDDDHAEIETMRRVLALPPVGEDDDNIAPTISLAGYYCAAERFADARALVSAAFVEANRDLLLADAGFVSKCSELANQIEMSAPEVLLSASPAPVEGYEIRLAYLQIRDEGDRARAIRVARGICTELGIAVPGIERVAPPRAYPTGSDLRYYYTEQRPQALATAQRIEDLMRTAGWGEATLDARPVVGLQGLPKDTIEIWFPASGAQDAEGAGADPRFSCFAASDTLRLVAALNAADRTARVRAGQLVANRVRDPRDTEIVAALLDQLMPPASDELTATGRLNILYMLNARSGWMDEFAPTLRERLELVETRATQNGIAIGSQTRDCIDKLRAKLGGQRGEDTCGQL